jgi:hypothetical protein
MTQWRSKHVALTIYYCNVHEENWCYRLTRLCILYTYKNDEQSFQCTCMLYKKYFPITVKYSKILHHNTLWSSIYFPYRTITKSTKSLLATWKDCLYPYTNCLLQMNVGETRNSVATFIRNCSRTMPTYYVKNQMRYVENPLKFLRKLKIHMLFIQEWKWV